MRGHYHTAARSVTHNPSTDYADFTDYHIDQSAVVYTSYAAAISAWFLACGSKVLFQFFVADFSPIGRKVGHKKGSYRSAEG
jgi:hypothetical protein